MKANFIAHGIRRREQLLLSGEAAAVAEVDGERQRVGALGVELKVRSFAAAETRSVNDRRGELLLAVRARQVDGLDAGHVCLVARRADSKKSRPHHAWG